ncbi:hypothetical protein JZO69_09865 [Enterococcus sp. DIV0869a]|uniref:Uncharacterized protein n=1 Tax=Candidatus Enterococcus ikei TaxID=2815326 RepID=A0ABS3H0H9_9ENTE|nr:hypothetical protein [Enterococcus sp. DIV0869a]
MRGNAPTLVVNGSFAFNSGDKYYALHNVNYTYTYVRQPKGNVKCTGVVKDVYDFAWSKYNSITTAIANNYAVTMQRLGLIKPYNIEIRYNWG